MEWIENKLGALLAIGTMVLGIVGMIGFGAGIVTFFDHVSSKHAETIISNADFEPCSLGDDVACNRLFLRSPDARRVMKRSER